MDVTRLIFKICYVSPLENNAMSLSKINCLPLIYDYDSIDYGLWRCRYS